MHDVEAWMESNNNGAGRNACAIEVDGSRVRFYCSGNELH